MNAGDSETNYGLETVPLWYFNVFGPRQDTRTEYSAVIPKFITHDIWWGADPEFFVCIGCGAGEYQ